MIRCAIYSWDTGILLCAGLVPIIWWRSLEYHRPIFDHWAFHYPIFESELFLFFALWLSFMTYRLATAYRRYLGFRHALVVSLWSQLIFLVLLCAATAMDW